MTEENGVVELLPALPDNYAKSGKVTDMIVNGAKLSFEWQNGVVTKVTSDKPIAVYDTHLSETAEYSNIVITEAN